MFFRSLVFVLLVLLPSFLLAQSSLLTQSSTDKCPDGNPNCFTSSAQDTFVDLLDVAKPALTEPAREVLKKPETDQISISLVRPPEQVRERFHWGPAFSQSLGFLAIEHSYRMATSRWDRVDMQGPFFRDWFSAVSGVRWTKWNDGDPFLCNYIGHPLQGSVSGFIQIQNDPRGRALKIGKSKEYWHSRLRATAWAAAYSTQFEIGPISEASLGNIGKFEYPTDSGKLTNGTGVVDFVVTPVIGLGWMLTEDALDRFVNDKLERKYNNFGTRVLRGALNPSRTMSNFLRLKKPWYRDRSQTAR